MASPHPTPRPGLLRIPAPNATQLEVRLAPLADRDVFDPLKWRRVSFTTSTTFPGWWECDLDPLGLTDGTWEYEFIIDGSPANPVPDPWAQQITRFGGYRGLAVIQGGKSISPVFRWDNELPPGVSLPQNNKIVIYEMPVHWMSSNGDLARRQVDLATFDEALFEHLDDLVSLGINTIELLPIEDSPDTLNWGYGTRFFFAPDIDMGGPVDLKYFIKTCHQRGIRIILDVVMNHAKECPLETTAFDWYFTNNVQPPRNAWGGTLFLYKDPAPGTSFYAAREFQYEMAEYWVQEYRIDGFRIDEFVSIDHWEFVQTFRDRAWAAHLAVFPDRPFIVIAEDSNRRFQVTRDGSDNPNGRKVVDSIWNFSYRDESRSLVTNQITTQWGQPSRSDRMRALVSGDRMWDGLPQAFREGYGDLSQAINYLTSHDVQQGVRMMNFILAALLQLRGLGDGSVDNVKGVVDTIASQPSAVQDAHSEALDRVRSAFALLMTSVGIPMFLAGEEFADVHDLSAVTDDKMSDPVNWDRRSAPGHQALWNQVSELVHLRTSNAALERDEVEFFYFHPDTDQNSGARVFAYARTGGQPLGSMGQVAVVGNCGSDNFASFDLPWPWGSKAMHEIGIPTSGNSPQLIQNQTWLRVSLAPFQFRVFTL